MYDVHAHILPGLDDGPRSMDEALGMARVASESGTRVLLATPHRRDVTEGSSVQHVKDLVVEMGQRMRQQGIDLELALGMENHLDLGLPGEAAAGRALPMAGSRYILVEMPFFGRPNYVESVLFQLQVQGMVPVLAHPERIEAFQRDPSMLADLVEGGMLTQVTAGSLVGSFGRTARRLGRTMLERGLVHVLASDAHRSRGARSPRLAPGLEAASRLVGVEEARAMVVDRPRAILENAQVTAPSPKAAAPSRRWWRPWAG